MTHQQNNFVNWFIELTDTFNEWFEVRPKFIPDTTWEEYFRTGLTPQEAINKYYQNTIKD